MRGPRTWTLLLHQVTGTQEVRVDGNGLLPDPELSAGLLVSDGVDLHLLPRDTCRVNSERQTRSFLLKRLYLVNKQVRQMVLRTAFHPNKK